MHKTTKQTKAPESAYCKARKIAEHVGVTPSAVWGWKRKGLIPFYKIAGTVRFKIEDVERLMTQGKQAAQ
jgi:predicted site-specific integrase-resolvase